MEQKVATTPKALQTAFGAMPRSRIALETGMHSPWVSRSLGKLGHEVIVAHARNMRLIGDSRKKDDRLALTPTGLLMEGHSAQNACTRFLSIADVSAAEEVAVSEVRYSEIFLDPELKGAYIDSTSFQQKWRKI